MSIRQFNFSILFLIMISSFSFCTKDNPNGNDPDHPKVTGNPSIRNISPSSTFAGNKLIITGTNFGIDKSAVIVAFDEVDAEIISLSNTEIEVVVPPRGEKETVRIRVKVENRTSNIYIFKYDYPAPAIESLSENAANEGSEIDIIGSGFGDVKKDISVTFDGIGSAIVSVSDQLIRVTVPGYTGKKTVEIQVKVREKLSNKVSFSYTDILFSNPVSTRSLPDPTLIKAPDGWFYLYATEDIRNMPIMRSQNLTDWDLVATAFTNSTRPTFEPNGGLWAPNVNYINGKYVIYYSMSVWGGEWTCGIGVATSDNPAGPFTDRGKLFRSNEINVQNSIDPDFIEDDGKNYLFWGSFRGIYMIEMSDDGLSVRPGALKQQVAGTYFEGVSIHKRDDYYYMFASIGSCCNGLSSTYQLVVGRSANLTGPYVNKSGRAMMSNNYTLVINKNASFVGNGHCSQIVQDDQGADWILYHGIKTDNASARVLMLDRVRWDEDGWPYISDGTPSITAPAPVFD